MTLQYLINNLITSGLVLADPDVLRKHKVLNCLQAAIIFLAPLLGLFYVYIGALYLFYTCITVAILMAVGMLLLRKTKNLVLSGNFALFVLWAAGSIISWSTGEVMFTPRADTVPASARSST